MELLKLVIDFAKWAPLTLQSEPSTLCQLAKPNKYCFEFISSWDCADTLHTPSLETNSKYSISQE